MSGDGRYYPAVGNTPLPMPPEATLHAPGSPGKIAVMTWRFEHGFSVFHPDDAREVDLRFSGEPRRSHAGHAQAANPRPLVAADVPVRTDKSNNAS